MTGRNFLAALLQSGPDRENRKRQASEDRCRLRDANADICPKLQGIPFKCYRSVYLNYSASAAIRSTACDEMRIRWPAPLEAAQREFACSNE
jgi:hypothetical protein